MLAKALVKTGRFMDLKELTDVKRSSIVLPEVFYAEAASTFEFLFAVYGKDKFLDFCRTLRKMPLDKSWEAAFLEVYKFRNLEELNSAWVEFLGK